MAEYNGKCGMAAVLFNLLDEPAGAGFFARMSLSSHGGERDCGHTGNYFNILWAMPGVALPGPQATGAWMKEFGEWYYDLSRQWDGGFDHLGPPEPDFDSYSGWDATGACLLAYAVPLKSLWHTGKRPGKVSPLAAAAAEQFIRTSRGWTQGYLYSLYGIRVEGLRILAKHHVEEGIRACVGYIRNQNPWASEQRTPELTKILVGYGAHAQSVVADLERIAADFAGGEPDFPKNLSVQKADTIREAIRQIQASNDHPELTHIQ